MFHRALFPGERSTCGNFKSHFSLNLLLSQNYEVHPRKMGITPEKDPGTSPFTLRETVPICYHRSCLFRRVCQCAERERERDVWGRRILNASKRCKVTYPLILGRGLFLFRRAKIELPLPGFEPTTLDSVTFGPIFPLFWD